MVAEVLPGLGHDGASGALFDLGVSSPQLDRPERGFSYRGDGPLDMRMDPRRPVSAADVVNGAAEAELGAAAAAPTATSATPAASPGPSSPTGPIATTDELAEIVRDAMPAPARRRGGHPARRTFQAIRIEVNDELGILPGTLDDAIDVLVPGGRCVAIAYHSGEDRIVKDRFRHAATGGWTCPPHLPDAARRAARGPPAAPRRLAADRRRDRREPPRRGARLRAVEKLDLQEVA